MLVRSRQPGAVTPAEITPQGVYRRRRQILQSAAALGLAGSMGGHARAQLAPPAGSPLARLPSTASPLSTDERPTPYKDVTGYNNFYEFGLEKDDPARYAHMMKVRPWSVLVEGEVARPGRLDIDDLLRLAPMEERIYRMRCVEGWSMVIPWIGYPLSALIRKVEPTGNARFIEFFTLADSSQMKGLSSSVIAWPYTEGLRMDEANHPLTLLTFGLYGQVLPNQNGAPVRMVVPWKYGFKSGKSIVKIRFVEKMPLTSWMRSAPQEYGFYSNVNPQVSHPRWSQATERRIGEDGLLQRKRPTLMFNGYADQVASLYAGMDLRKNY